MAQQVQRDIDSSGFVGSAPMVRPDSVHPGSGVVVGRVIDASTREPLGGVRVIIDSLWTAESDAAGVFRLSSVPRGRSVVRVKHIGYLPVSRVVELAAGDSVEVIAALVPAVSVMREVTVVDSTRGRNIGDIGRSSGLLEGEKLDRHLESSIAATLSKEQGVAMRYNGPMATQPVVRGLSGDRVPVLEDGLRSSDIASTAPDHSITIDPLSARRVELVRGPAALRYGTNTMGGVINVDREDVPRSVVPRATATAATQLESVNRGVAGSMVAHVPLGSTLAMRVEATGRTSGDTRTPRGKLPFTDYDNRDVALGMGSIRANGYVGIAVRDAQSSYGVPSSFDGVTLPGAHDGGVYVRLRRSTVRAEGEHHVALGPVHLVGARVNYVRFVQGEHERGGFVGTRFGQLASSSELFVRYKSGRRSGILGLTTHWRDWRAAGSFTGTRPAVLRSGSLYAIEELDMGPLRLAAGIRAEHLRVRPLDSTETRLLTGVRTRTFSTVTGSLGAALKASAHVTLGANVARAFRPPAIEELFSAGPHLAAYAYEIGNPRLAPELGVGMDAFIRTTASWGEIELTAFRNRIRNFIHYAPLLDSATGFPVRDPRLRRYIVYAATQADAELLGWEGSVHWNVLPSVTLNTRASHVQGTRRSDNTPLPAIPPFRAASSIRFDRARWFVTAELERVSPGRRVPRLPLDAGSCDPAVVDGEAEQSPAEYCATRGYVLMNAGAGLRWSLGGRTHLVTLGINNLFDTEWRDHLWRAKQVAPQPGRNVKLLYRVTL